MSTELTPFAEIDAPRVGPDAATPLADPALGRLVMVAAWCGARQDATGPFRRPRVVLVGPEDTTTADVLATTSLAALYGIGVTRLDPHRTADVDPSDAGDDEPAANGRAGGAGAAADPRDALPPAAAVAAVDRGRRLADAEIDAGADLVVPGLAGGDHGTALGVLTAVLTGLEPVAAVTVPDTDPVTWGAAVTDLRDTLFRLRDRDRDVVSLIAAVGGAELGALAGLVAQAAVRRTPVLLDGLPATIAAVLAHRLAPGADAWLIAAGQAPDRPGRRLQDMLGLPVVAALETSSAAAAGAVLVLPLIQAALTVGEDRAAAVEDDVVAAADLGDAASDAGSPAAPDVVAVD
ncbi:nicotinate-nucleotide--dimethylbenzimidazole phosphoribosyltransferase [Nakamurella deserti]|uniref:nicotinate-nucleotide--dimethylbenzimidazole phosphoribosyltransferase n=1 Tax=Nakamurella deserti TaxID=2164074 RepID=UPI000DBE3212|nr:nicotinate-nucleotide--dimethylbenzimidazole phosphoribosyltransferase [Nakamurella deserti]